MFSMEEQFEFAREQIGGLWWSVFVVRMERMMSQERRRKRREGGRVRVVVIKGKNGRRLSVCVRVSLPVEPNTCSVKRLYLFPNDSIKRLSKTRPNNKSARPWTLHVNGLLHALIDWKLEISWWARFPFSCFRVNVLQCGRKLISHQLVDIRVKEKQTFLPFRLMPRDRKFVRWKWAENVISSLSTKWYHKTVIEMYIRLKY